MIGDVSDGSAELAGFLHSDGNANAEFTLSFQTDEADEFIVPVPLNASTFTFLGSALSIFGFGSFWRQRRQH